MATLYAKNVTGNWNAATSWSAVSSVSVDDAGVPDATTDCVFDALFTGAITLTASTTVNSVVCATGAAGTLTHNASVTLTIDSQNGGGDSLIFVGTMTYGFTAATSRITFTGAGTSDITCAGITLPNVTFNNTGDTFSILDALLVGGTSTTALYLQAGTFTHNNNAVTLNGTTPTISGAFSFHTLNFVGTAVKTDNIKLASNITVTNTLNIDGNSAINRVLVSSDTLGTARTLTLTGATVSGCSNVDFRDITFAGSPDFSAITGGSGDCGGNTGATFTTADDWYWHVDAANWSATDHWFTATNGGGSRMSDADPRGAYAPLPQDSFYFDSSSFDSNGPDITMDMPRLGSIDMTGTTEVTSALIFNNTVGSYYYFGNAVVGTSGFNRTGQATHYYQGRGSHTMNKGGDDGLYIQSIGGTYTLTGNITVANGRTFALQYGTFDADTYNVTLTAAGVFNSDNSNVRTLLMGSGTWAINGWDIETTTNLSNPTTLGETSLISWGIATSSTNRNFYGGGCTYNNLSVVANTTGTEIMTITGSNTFNTFTINTPKTVKFTAGTDNNVSSFVATGTAGSAIVIDSTSASACTLSDTTGTNTVYYCTIGTTGAVNVEGGATWNALATDNNTVTAGTGWTTGGAIVTGIMTTRTSFWGDLCWLIGIYISSMFL